MNDFQKPASLQKKVTHFFVHANLESLSKLVRARPARDFPFEIFSDNLGKMDRPFRFAKRTLSHLRNGHTQNDPENAQ